MMKSFFKKKYVEHLLIAAGVFSLYSCVSTQQEGNDEPISSGVLEPVLGSTDLVERENLFSLDSEEIAQLYVEVLKEQASGDNLQRVNALLAKDRRSDLEQAILVINLFQNFLVSHSQIQDDFEIPYKETKSVTLAELSALYNVDLIDLIENNPFLQSVEVYHLLLRVREYPTSEEAGNLIATTIQNKLTYFTEFVDLVSAMLQKNKEKEDSVVEVKPEDIKPKAEDLLNQAEELLSLDRYSEAITVLKQIEKGDRSYELAQQKIFFISNKAVEDLRRQAALAYQKANHINTDFEAREAHLQEAKKYLEAALELYPHAEHIGRVRRNLKVIDDNLNFLKKGRRD